jgi:hypothetical protein
MVKLKGISPLISFALTIAIIVTSVTTVWLASRPVLAKSEDAAIIAESKNVMKVIDDAIKDVLYERKGSSRLVSITITGGSYRVNPTDDSFDFELETSDLFVEGTAQQKTGNLYVAGAREVTASQGIAGGVDSLILENGHTLLAIRKVNATTAINTTHLITRLRQKDLDKNVTPLASNFTINSLTNSANGTGFTEFVDNGTKMGRGQIRARINSDSGINYTLTFTLPSNADYFIVEVSNVSGGDPKNVTATFLLNVGGDDVQTDGDRMAIAHSTSANAVSALVSRGSQFISRSATASGTNSLLELTQGFDGNKMIVAFTRGANTVVQNADFTSILKWGGSMSFGTSQEPKYYSWLYYPIVDIINTEKLSKGTYQLSVYNNGTVNGKAQVEIAVV